MAILSVRIKSILKGTRFGTYLRRQRWNKGILTPSYIDSQIEKYMSDRTPDEKEKVRQDIVTMAMRYRFSPEEYFCYHFEHLSEEQRKKFISDLNRIDFCERLNKAKNLAIFDDKLRSAEVFSKYYGRDLCGVKSHRDMEKFFEFVKKHPKFMFKPLTGTCGAGIKIIDLSDMSEEERKVESERLVDANTSGKSDGFVVEELIVQTPEMAQFHDNSLNTVRIATVRFDSGAEPIAAFFRTGRGGNIVDNAGAGGVFGTIELESGVIDAVGDEYGNSYETHPDTNIAIKGFTIPRWNEAVAMAKELAAIVPTNRYAGWDLALTENGWVMVEGNARGQFVWQMPRQKGFQKEADAILVRLGKKPMKKLSI